MRNTLFRLKFTGHRSFEVLGGAQNATSKELDDFSQSATSDSITSMSAIRSSIYIL